MRRGHENSPSRPSWYRRIAAVGALVGSIIGGGLYAANAEETPVQPVPVEVSNNTTTTEVHGECNPNIDVCVPGVTAPVDANPVDGNPTPGETIPVVSIFPDKECDPELDGDNNCGSTTTTIPGSTTTTIPGSTTTTIPRNDCETRNNDGNPNNDCGAGHTN